MDNILLITTGGTIACRETERGLSPALSGEELLSYIPEVSKICNVSVHNLFSIDSTDLTTAQRRQIALHVWENYGQYDGFVVAHGTDSLSYTAALLCHMLCSFNKPVILTGSQRPMGIPGSDAPRNMLSAFLVACSGWVGVAAVMNAQIIHGRHVVKVRSNTLDSFRSANLPLAGIIREDNRVILSHPPENKTQNPTFHDVRDIQIFVLKIVPDLDPAAIDFLRRYHCVIIESFGAGGIPSYLEHSLKELIEAGTRVYITSQCLEGGVDLGKYAVGHRAESIGAISLGKRTTEDALAAIQCGEL